MRYIKILEDKIKFKDGVSLSIEIVSGSCFHFSNEGKLIGAKFKAFVKDDYFIFENLISEFILEPMGGCKGICISRGVQIMPQWRGKGLGVQFLNLRERIAKDFGYSAMMCTTTFDNEPQRKILAHCGWEMVKGFTNARTNNRVCLYYKNISDNGVFQGDLPL
jgi:GNAT superfamily N-acetyltransferase